MDGTISVSILVSTISILVFSVNFFPIALKLIIAGIAFRARLMGEKGTVTSKYLSQTVWISSVTPLKPPGYKPPARTNVLMFTAMITDPMMPKIILLASLLGSIFGFIFSSLSIH